MVNYPYQTPLPQEKEEAPRKHCNKFCKEQIVRLPFPAVHFAAIFSLYSSTSF